MLFRDKRNNEIKNVYSLEIKGGKVHIRFSKNGKVYTYNADNIEILEDANVEPRKSDLKVYKLAKQCYVCHKITSVYTYIVFDDGTNENVAFPWDRERLQNCKSVEYNIMHMGDPSIEYYGLKIVGDDEELDRILMNKYPDKIKICYSKTQKRSYPMNLCDFCGAKQGWNFIYRLVNEKIGAKQEIETVEFRNDVHASRSNGIIEAEEDKEEFDSPEPEVTGTGSVDKLTDKTKIPSSQVGKVNIENNQQKLFFNIIPKKCLIDYANTYLKNTEGNCQICNNHTDRLYCYWDFKIENNGEMKLIGQKHICALCRDTIFWGTKGLFKKNKPTTKHYMEVNQCDYETFKEDCKRARNLYDHNKALNPFIYLKLVRYMPRAEIDYFRKQGVFFDCRSGRWVLRPIENLQLFRNYL